MYHYLSKYNLLRVMIISNRSVYLVCYIYKLFTKIYYLFLLVLIFAFSAAAASWSVEPGLFIAFLYTEAIDFLYT